MDHDNCVTVLPATFSQSKESKCWRNVDCTERDQLVPYHRLGVIARAVECGSRARSTRETQKATAVPSHAHLIEEDKCQIQKASRQLKLLRPPMGKNIYLYMDLENSHVIGCGKEGSLDVGVSIQALRVAGRNYRTKYQAAMSIFTLTFPMWTPLMVRERERDYNALASQQV